MTLDQNVLYGGGFLEPVCASFGELICRNLQQRGDEIVLINGATGSQWSAKDVLNASIKMANALNAFGIKSDDVVGIVSENRLEFITIAFGTFILNAQLAPINVGYIKNDLVHALNISKPKIVFASSASLESVTLSCANFAYVRKVVSVDESKFSNENLKSFIRRHVSPTFKISAQVNKNFDMRIQTAMILLSSGTTGVAKGCEITQYNMATCITAFKKRMAFLRQYSQRTVTLNITPWFHVMGMVNIFSILMCEGISTVSLSKFEPRIFLGCIEKYRVISTSIPPPVVVFLSKTPMLDEFDLSSLRAIFCGAAPLKQETENLVKERFRKRLTILQGYGMSETTAGIIYGVFGKEEAGSTGMLEEGIYAKIIDESGRSLEAMKVGELCVRGNRIMKGYANDEKSTSEMIDKDGWLHTGDLGYYNKNHQFFIVDRLKELIKYKGFQVPPAELEGLLLSHPKIKDVGIIGIPDEVAGELPFAFVVKQPDAALTAAEVQDFVAENASNSKWLRGGVRFVDEIPKNPSGKILRKKLRESYGSMSAKL